MNTIRPFGYRYIDLVLSNEYDVLYLLVVPMNQKNSQQGKQGNLFLSWVIYDKSCYTLCLACSTQ